MCTTGRSTVIALLWFCAFIAGPRVADAQPAVFELTAPNGQAELVVGQGQPFDLQLQVHLASGLTSRVSGKDQGGKQSLRPPKSGNRSANGDPRPQPAPLEPENALSGSLPHAVALPDVVGFNVDIVSAQGIEFTLRRMEQGSMGFSASALPLALGRSTEIGILPNGTLGPGAVETFTFRAPTQVGTYSVSLDRPAASDSAGNDIASSVAGTGVTVTVAPDGDGDGVPDAVDNCPNTPNPDQADADGDGVGDACDNIPPGAVVITTDTVIGCDNLYDGQDVVVDGCVVTIDCPHTFKSLLVINGGVVTHSPYTGDPQRKLDVTILQGASVDSLSRISGDGKGYGSDSGAGPGGGYSYTGGGGGYGGRGGAVNGVPSAGGTVYGSITEPVDLGSGGGRAPYGSVLGGAGGGSIRLTVGGVLTVHGRVTVDGLKGVPWGGNWPDFGGGGGSGGSVYLRAGTLTGTGVITANGGDAGGTSAGGGGGGRIGVYYDSNGFTGATLACGGTGYVHGGAGTQFSKSSAQASGDLLVANCGASGATTEIKAGSYRFDHVEIASAGHVTISGTGLVKSTEVEMVSAGLTVTETGQLESTQVVVSPASVLLLTGTGSLRFNDLQVSDALWRIEGGSNVVGNHVAVLSGGVLVLDRSLILPSLDLAPGGLLTHTAGVKGFDLTVTGDLTVPPDGVISGDEKGYGSDSGAGPGGGYSYTGGGGGYGGRGGAVNGVPSAGGTVYGSITEPVDLGSGGGRAPYGSVLGGAGGGSIRLTVGGVLTVYGRVTADGLKGAPMGGYPQYGGGGGSGGSLYLRAGTLTGTGVITANGGDAGGASAGGGGGGRIAIYSDNIRRFPLQNFAVRGGIGYENGKRGTIYGIDCNFNGIPDALEDLCISCDFFNPAGVDDFATQASFKVVMLDGTEVGIGIWVDSGGVRHGEPLSDLHTTIGRSDSFFHGDLPDLNGATVSGGGHAPFPNTLAVAPEACPLPEGFPGDPDWGHEVHTEILSINLTNGDGTMAVRAGQPFFDSVAETGRSDLYQNSFGEVQAVCYDFPADSFFNIFVEVDAGVVKLYNKTPILLRSEIDQFPPDFSSSRSIYLHDPNVPATPLFDADGIHVAYLVSAGHGTPNLQPPTCEAKPGVRSPTAFVVDAHSVGLPPGFVPNHVRDDAGSATQQTTVYTSSGRVAGNAADTTNVRLEQLAAQPGSPSGFAAGDTIQSLSFGRDGTVDPVTLTPAAGSLYFSVDRESAGESCTQVRLEAAKAQAAGDIFSAAAPPFGSYTGPPSPACGKAGRNCLVVDRTALGLSPGAGRTDEDDVIALELSRPRSDDRYFMSFTGPSFSSNSATIYVYDPRSGPFGPLNLVRFASAADLGLLPGDVIDALALSDVSPGTAAVPNGTMDPGQDRVLFSLAPGSPTLAAGGYSAADIFVSSFDGSRPSVYATAAALGLLATDNIDAIDIGPSIRLGDCNGNGVNDACDLDRGFSQDCNGNQVLDECDIRNQFSVDCNHNDIPDECESDSDADGWIDDCDNCPSIFNPDQLDSDGDGIGDVCDNCPLDFNPDQRDSDGDGIGDACTQCGADSDCDDGDACTTDLCDNGVCRNQPQPAGTVCGEPPQGDCDLPDTCDGEGHCGATVKPAGTICRAIRGLCDVEEVCDGRSMNCPPDNFESATKVCRPQAGACDVAEFCTGSSVECPPDELALAGAPCGDPGSTACDKPDSCDGAGACILNFEPAETPCGDDGNDCTSDACDGAGICAHPPLQDGTPCLDDGIECTADVCVGGGCIHPPRPGGTLCGNSHDTACDHADTCDGHGLCLSNLEPDGASCSDDLFCNGLETCRLGRCTDGPDPCIDLAHCDESRDVCLACVHDEECYDGNACTEDACVLNVCVHRTIPSCRRCTATGDCDDGNACTEDVCNATGFCENPIRADGWPCGDGLFCNGMEACRLGVCADGPDPCLDAAHCDESRDICLACVRDEECADGDPCTHDACISNSCVRTVIPGCRRCTNASDCGDGNLCTEDVCNATGACENPIRPDGWSCDDGLFCNGQETCRSGMCTDGPDPCIDLAHCDETRDICVPCVRDEECDDGDACTDDACVNNACVHTPIPHCGTVVYLDIKPGSCPNPIDGGKLGVVPMALVGTPAFDVRNIVTSSLTLSRRDGVGGFVTPLTGRGGPTIEIEDAATPFTGAHCACHELTRDGIDDLLLKFSAPVVVETLGLDSVGWGVTVELVVRGRLVNGTAFEASDCIVVPQPRSRGR